MYSNFKEQAIEYVKQAVQEDNAGNYAKAFPLYMNALEYFKTHLKYEKNPEIKEAITQKFTEYLRRALEIRAVLDDGGPGPASNGGEGAVVARPKTKPKDGEGGGDGEDPEQAKLRSGLEQRNPRRGASYYAEGQDDDFDDQLSLPSSSSSSSSASKPCIPEAEEEEEDDDDDEEEEEQEEEEKSGDYPLKDMPSKFLLYQQSVQSPKGDISYMQKFFLMYAGGRLPLHLQEDFCGTALLSAEWIRSNPRRTAVGLDLDLEALNWCMENNINRVGADGYSRTSLFHGNVLQPLEAKLVKFEPHELISNITLEEGKDGAGNCALESAVQVDSTTEDKYMKNVLLPPRDIVCAFNYSCCCLHKRADLVLYFKHVLDALSKKGGIFVMDLYGGISSERKLRLQRRFANFTYVWEQAEFDIIERKTRISLHFHLQKQKRKLRHAFSYSWRLWSLPEIKDCLEEAGFRSVHFWLREMPDTEEFRMTEGFGAGRDVKYEEVKSFQQQDAWNAYIVGVA